MLKNYKVEIEEQVLGILIKVKNSIVDVFDIINEDCFEFPANKAIFKCILSLSDQNLDIDYLMIVNEVKRKGYDTLVNHLYIAQLIAIAGTDSQLENYCYILKEHSIKKKLQEMANKIIKNIENNVDFEEIINHAESTIFQLTNIQSSNSFVHISKIIDENLIDFHALQSGEKQLSGLPSGFTSLDRLTLGWQKSDLIIIAARPAMGKTAFVVSMAKKMAIEHFKSVAICSLEMSKKQLGKRFLLQDTEINTYDLNTGNINNDAYNELITNAEIISTSNIFIDDTPAISLMNLRSKLRKMKAKNNIDIAMIDYLQLMTGEKGYNGNREGEVSYISRGLKLIAKELDIPIIALSQLNRAVESRQDKRPQLSDLRESGAIEQDADIVIFLHRPEKYGILQTPEGNSTEGLAEIIIAKHRNGSCESVSMKFIPEKIQFMDFENINEIPF